MQKGFGWWVVAAGFWLAVLPLAGVLAQEPTRISVAAFADLALYPRQSAPATVLSLNDVALSAEVAGRVTDIEVRVGDLVSKGQSLVRLDCRDPRVALIQAEAELKRSQAARGLAQRQYQRALTLEQQRNISAELRDQRENEVALAEAQQQAASAGREAAALAVARCEIQAPFAGVVLARLTQLGAWVTPGTPVIRLLDREHLEVSAQVPAQLWHGLAAAERVWLEDNGQVYPLRVRAAVAALDPAARSREVRLLFQEASALPGVAGRLVWEQKTPHAPAELVVERNGQLGVFVAEQGMARFVALPHAREGAPAAAPTLAPRQQLVVDGRYGLQDGDAVQVK